LIGVFVLYDNSAKEVISLGEAALCKILFPTQICLKQFLL